MWPVYFLSVTYGSFVTELDVREAGSHKPHDAAEPQCKNARPRRSNPTMNPTTKKDCVLSPISPCE